MVVTAAVIKIDSFLILVMWRLPQNHKTRICWMIFGYVIMEHASTYVISKKDYLMPRKFVMISLLEVEELCPLHWLETSNAKLFNLMGLV
jgi:hypothetical protein